MPWPTRSTRFASYVGTPAANTFTSLGVVPAGKVWLVKEWSAINFGAAARSFFVVARISGTDVFFDGAQTLASGGVTGNPHRHFVMNAGDTLGLFTSTNQLLHVTVSGAALS